MIHSISCTKDSKYQQSCTRMRAPRYAVIILLGLLSHKTISLRSNCITGRHHPKEISRLAASQEGPASNISNEYPSVRPNLVSRRSSLQKVAAAVLLFSVTSATGASPVYAEQETMNENITTTETKKPYAPLENLLPAVRVRVMIDTAVQAVRELQNDNQTTTNKQANLQLLHDILLIQSKDTNSFFKTTAEQQAAKTYLTIDTWQPWNKARQQAATESINFLQKQQPFTIMPTNNPLIRANQAFEQWGTRRQFDRLVRQQIALEQGNPMRAAMNAYTNNLLYADSFTLTAPKSERSRMIRNDQIPDVTSVVRSDLDLRDLYRNQMLTAWDDATAEFQSDDDQSYAELQALLEQAQTACNEWFGFVPLDNLQQAMSVVGKE